MRRSWPPIFGRESHDPTRPRDPRSGQRGARRAAAARCGRRMTVSDVLTMDEAAAELRVSRRTLQTVLGKLREDAS